MNVYVVWRLSGDEPLAVMSTPKKALALCKKLEKQAEDLDIFDHLCRSFFYEEYEIDKGVSFERKR